MEDKEREFYFQWITQLMQYNIQIMNNMMAMSMQMMQQRPLTMPPPMSPNISAFMPSPQDMDRIVKSMLGQWPGKADDDNELK